MPKNSLKYDMTLGRDNNYYCGRLISSIGFGPGVYCRQGQVQCVYCKQYQDENGPYKKASNRTTYPDDSRAYNNGSSSSGFGGFESSGFGSGFGSKAHNNGSSSSRFGSRAYNNGSSSSEFGSYTHLNDKGIETVLEDDGLWHCSTYQEFGLLCKKRSYQCSSCKRYQFGEESHHSKRADYEPSAKARPPSEYSNEFGEESYYSKSPSDAASSGEDEYSKMSIRQLKFELEKYGISYIGVTEKSELIYLLRNRRAESGRAESGPEYGRAESGHGRAESGRAESGPGFTDLAEGKLFKVVNTSDDSVNGQVWELTKDDKGNFFKYDETNRTFKYFLKNKAGRLISIKEKNLIPVKFSSEDEEKKAEQKAEEQKQTEETSDQDRSNNKRDELFLKAFIAKNSEEKEIMDIFKKLDTDGSKTLSKIEVIKAFKNPEYRGRLHRLFGFPNSKIAQEDGTRNTFMKIWNEIDKNNDGKIQLSELLMYYIIQNNRKGEHFEVVPYFDLGGRKNKRKTNKKIKKRKTNKRNNKRKTNKK